MYPKNAASPPRIAVGSIYLIADGTIQTSGASVRVRPEGGADAGGGGTLAYDTTSGAIFYTPTQAETNYTAFCVTVYKASCTSASVTVVTTAESTAGKVSLGSAQTTDITGTLSGAVGSVTGNVGGNVVGSVASVTAGVTLANGAITNASLAGNMEIVFETDFATNYNTTRNAWATNAQDFVGTTAADPFNGQVVAASVTGAVGSVTGAVGSVTGNVGGNVVGSVASVTAGVTLANGAITDASLAGNMEIVFETDFATNYNTTRNAWATNAQDFVGTTAADPFNGQIVAASVTTKTGYSVSTIVDGAIGADAVADIFSTTTIAEAYAADGAAGTPAQILYLIQQALSEFAISGTTITAKKLDGSTTAATFTIDSATTPTSRTRAT